MEGTFVPSPSSAQTVLITIYYWMRLLFVKRGYCICLKLDHLPQGIGRMNALTDAMPNTHRHTHIGGVYLHRLTGCRLAFR